MKTATKMEKYAGLKLRSGNKLVRKVGVALNSREKKTRLLRTARSAKKTDPSSEKTAGENATSGVQEATAAKVHDSDSESKNVTKSNALPAFDAVDTDKTKSAIADSDGSKIAEPLSLKRTRSGRLARNVKKSAAGDTSTENDKSVAQDTMKEEEAVKKCDADRTDEAQLKEKEVCQEGEHKMAVTIGKLDQETQTSDSEANSLRNVRLAAARRKKVRLARSRKLKIITATTNNVESRSAKVARGKIAAAKDRNVKNDLESDAKSDGALEELDSCYQDRGEVPEEKDDQEPETIDTITNFLQQAIVDVSSVQLKTRSFRTSRHVKKTIRRISPTNGLGINTEDCKSDTKEANCTQILKGGDATEINKKMKREDGQFEAEEHAANANTQNVRKGKMSAIAGKKRKRSGRIIQNEKTIIETSSSKTESQNCSSVSAAKTEIVSVSAAQISTEANDTAAECVSVEEVGKTASEQVEVALKSDQNQERIDTDTNNLRKLRFTAASGKRAARSVRIARNIKKTFPVNAATIEDDNVEDTSKEAIVKAQVNSTATTAVKENETNSAQYSGATGKTDESECKDLHKASSAVIPGQKRTRSPTPSQNAKKIVTENTIAQRDNINAIFKETAVPEAKDSKTDTEVSSSEANKRKVKNEKNASQNAESGCRLNSLRKCVKDGSQEEGVTKGCIENVKNDNATTTAEESSAEMAEDFHDLVIDESTQKVESESDVQSDCEPTLQIHELSLHFKCGQCAESFDSVEALQAHKNSDHHTPGKTFQCDLCHREFKANYRLLVHKRTHTGERPFRCADCSASFMTKQVLENHIRIHLGDRPFKCSTCDASFIQKAGLRRHMYIHTSSRPHPCDICDASFPTKLLLDKHSYTHDCDNPVKKCHTCELEFETSSELRQHSVVHLNRKTYKCEVCEASFALSKTLRNHMRKHGGVKDEERPYVCEVCQKDFSRDSDLSRHKKMVHVVRSNEKCASPSP